MNTTSTLAAALFALCAAGTASAGPVYPDSGHVNTTSYTFKATADGDITAYFYGQDAAYTEVLGMLVDGGAPVADAHVGLSNHASSQGSSIDLGWADAGQIITFYIQVTAGSSDKWYSTTSMNSDGTNHIYSTAFTPTALLPGTTFISFEDLPTGASDHDYNDTSFVIKGVSAVPEPENLALLLGGLSLVGFMAGRREGTSN